jgi:hypothetical protein
MAVAIPTSIDEVTASWMSDATGWKVSSLRNELIGVGVGVSSVDFLALYACKFALLFEAMAAMFRYNFFG